MKNYNEMTRLAASSSKPERQGFCIEYADNFLSDF